MVRARLLTAAAALPLLAACQNPSPQPLTAADSTALSQLRTSYATAWNRGDVDGVVRLYSDTALVLLPDTTPLRGGNAVRTYLNTTLGTPHRPVLEITPTAMLGRQDLAVLAGTFTITIPADSTAAAAAPAPPPIAGHYLDAVTKSADGWKILYHAISYDAPPPAPPAAKPAPRRR
jgi:ketosteroid isomerase-like protein